MQKHLRLRQATAFERVRTQGNTWKQPALLLNLDHNHLPHNRYGFIVSKRLGKAVVRNRLRRQLRACVQQWHDSLQQGYDVVLITRPPILELSFQDLCGVLRTLMQRAGL